MNAATLESALPSEDDRRQQNILLSQDKEIRHAFMRKVFLIVISQIILTCIIVAPMIIHQPTRERLKDHRYDWVSFHPFFIVLLAILFYISVPTSYTQKFITWLVLTVTASVWVGCNCARFDPKLVLIAIAISLVWCTALCLFATQTTIDFTPPLKMLGVFIIAYIVLVILLAFFWENGVTWILLIGGIVLQSVCFVMSIRRMTGDSRNNSLALEDDIRTAIVLYAYIIPLFIFILMILDKTEN